MPLALIEFPADDPDRARRFWSGLLDIEIAPRSGGQGEGWQSSSSPALGIHARGTGPGDTRSLPYFEIGARVENRAVGDRVVTLNAAGSHASKRATPAMSTWPIPDGLEAAAAACVPVAFGTAQECLFTAGKLEAGQTVLIHAGAGGVGMAAIQLAKHAGATVLSTASSDEKLERLRDLGLDHGINYARENFADRTRELTDGAGAQVVLDSVGGQNLIDSIGALAYRGTLVSVGLAGRAGSAVEARDLWEKNNALRGVFLGGVLMNEYPRVHAMVADLLGRVASGGLR